MKKYSTIRCKDGNEVRQTLQALGMAGFHAVAGGQDGRTITITEVPETQYLVQARDQNGRAQRAYCSTKAEAVEVFEELARGYEYAEVLEGYPGEWESIAQTW